MSWSAGPIDLPRQLGSYVLVQRIAVGGMAEVYIAKTKGVGGFEKLVAIKVIHPRYIEDEHFVQLLVEEAKISVLLSHINVVQIFDLAHIDDTYFIVMEYIDGADTQRILRLSKNRKQTLPLAFAAYTIAETCRGLEYAHAKTSTDGKSLQIVHRDISPHNVLVSRAGEVKLVDFGIAKAALRSEQTEVGVIKGKYCYMSPEQARGKELDARSDIFSTGVVLHELLTGKPIYEKDSIPVMLDRVRRAEIPEPSKIRPDIPAELDRIVMKALAREPENRYQSAGDLSKELSEYLRSNWPAFSSSSVSDLLLDLLGRKSALRFDSDAYSSPSEASQSAQRFTVDKRMSVIYNRNSSKPPGPPRTTTPSKPPVLPATLRPKIARATSTAPKQVVPISAPPAFLPDNQEETPILGEEPTPSVDHVEYARWPANPEYTPYTPSFRSDEEYTDPNEQTQQEIRAFRGGLARVRHVATSVFSQKRVVFAALLSIAVAVLAVAMTNSTETNPALEIVSVPPGANVELDGKRIPGVTPVRIDEGLRLETTHTVSLSLEGYEDWEASFQPSESVVTQVAVLQPIRASLTVRTNPEGARVWVNGAFFGISPVEIPGIRSGQKLKVRVSKPRYEDKSVTWVAKVEDLNKVMNVSLQRRNAQSRSPKKPTP